MNSVIKYFILTNLSLISTMALAIGNATGNGGNSVVCKDDSGKIISTEIFDLYEARALRGATYVESNVDYKTQARKYINEVGQALNLRPNMEGSPQYFLEQNLNDIKLLPSGTGIATIPDNNSIIVPKNCQIVQTADFVEAMSAQNTIYVDSDIWNQLSETQKSALMVHETIYEILRNPGPKGNFVETDSVRTRLIVSQLFAGVVPESLDKLAGLPANEIPLLCATAAANEVDRRSSTFFLYKDNTGKTVLQFIGLADRKLLTRTTLNGQTYPDGSIEASGNVVSNFIDNLNVLVRYTDMSSTKNQIRVIDQNGYNQTESFVCWSAAKGSYN